MTDLLERPLYHEGTMGTANEKHDRLRELYEDGVAVESPMLAIDRLPTDGVGNLFLKAEHLQPIGSFKVGCYLDMKDIVEAHPDLGQFEFVAASAGNHAQGVALGIEKLRDQGYDVAATVFMPESTPVVKVEAVRDRGAHVELVPGTVKEALQIAETYPGFFLHPYDSEGVITANSRVGYEIMAQLPHTDMIFVPAGGGGLVAGVAKAVKAERPDIRVVAVQLEGADALVQSYDEKRFVSLNDVNGLSDGTAVKQPGRLTMQYIWRHVDAAITVSNEELGRALEYMDGMYREDSQQVATQLEPAGALALAAALSFERSKPEAARLLNIVAVASGQNADPVRTATLRSQFLASQPEKAAIQHDLWVANGATIR